MTTLAAIRTIGIAVVLVATAAHGWRMLAELDDFEDLGARRTGHETLTGDDRQDGRPLNAA